MTSTSTMAGMMAEEKDKGTLRSLIMANVKPIEYFLGVGGFVLIASVLSSLLFLPLINLTGTMYLKFFLVVFLGSLCSTILGATIGIIAENQMNANAIVSPVAIILGVIPMFAQFNDIIGKVASFLYVQAISDVLYSLGDPLKLKYILILLANFIICIIIFSFVYKKRRLDN